jgi:predicted house-cleaning NTP pyrophosphatase (Maf/HAM1 superfamily)
MDVQIKVITHSDNLNEFRVIVESSKVSGRHVAIPLARDKIAHDRGHRIQGLGGGFIDRVEGSRDNVMGLPTTRVLEALARHRISSSVEVK